MTGRCRIPVGVRHFCVNHTMHSARKHLAGQWRVNSNELQLKNDKIFKKGLKNICISVNIITITVIDNKNHLHIQGGQFHESVF